VTTIPPPRPIIHQSL